MAPINPEKVLAFQKQQAALDLTTTRAGRVSKAPAPYVPVAGGVKAKRASRKKETTVVCVHCQRGNSPTNNSIVYCDGCDATWHQKCHDPPIEDELITVKESQWFCRKCKPPKRRPAPVVRKTTNTVYSHPRLQHAPQLKVGGDTFNSDKIRAFASRQSHATLVELIVHLSNQNPTLPMFPRDILDPEHAERSLPQANEITAELEPLTTRKPVRKRRTNSAPAKPEINAINGKHNRDAEDTESKPLTCKRARTESGIKNDNLSWPSSHRTGQEKCALRNAIPFPNNEINDDPSSESDINFLTPAQLASTPAAISSALFKPAVKLETEVEVAIKVEGDIQEMSDHRLYPRPGNGFTTSKDPIELDIIAEAEGYPTFSHRVNKKLGKRPPQGLKLSHHGISN